MLETSGRAPILLPVITRVLQCLRGEVAHRVWVFSDLQQSVPAEAQRCLTTAVQDFKSLEMPCEQLWYLGDAVEGERLDFLEEMSGMQVEMLSSLGVPLKYVLGNHDFDHLRKTGGASGRTAIFRDAVRKVPGWRTTDEIESFYFLDSIGPFTVLFLSDHAAAATAPGPAGSWVSTHGTVHGQHDLYPHPAEEYQRLRDQLAAIDGPVITCSHYAFAGGNRPSDLHNQMLPLPNNVRLHLYGHAHIGDIQWAGKNRFRKISTIDDHPITQVDVASLEDGRGDAVRSAILEIYHDQTLGLYCRNHSARVWEESLLLPAKTGG